MQTFAPGGDANPNGHTAAEVLTALRGGYGARRFDFRYELLDRLGATVRDLDGVESCTISQDWLAPIKRSAQLVMRDQGDLDWLSDRIRPWVRLHLPPYGPSDWVEWPQGTFLLSAPRRNASGAQVITRRVEAYDLLQALASDKPDGRYSVAAATLYTTAIGALLNPYPRSITASGAALVTARDWDPGTSKLTIINDLLDAIGYESLSFDEYGTAVVRPYLLPDQRSEEYRYADSADAGLMVPEVDQELDLFDVPNKWILTVSDPDRPPISATYTNTDPGSPTSTVRRGRIITDFRTDEDAPDAPSLDIKVRKLAHEASQIYEAIEFTSALMPVHSGSDCYRITYGPLSINAKYIEQSWSMELRPGATMRHRARRVVSV